MKFTSLSLHFGVIYKNDRVGLEMWVITNNGYWEDNDKDQCDPKSVVLSMSFSPDGRWLAYGGSYTYYVVSGLSESYHAINYYERGYGFLVLWGDLDKETPTFRRLRDEENCEINYVAFSPDGKSLLACNNTNLLLWGHLHETSPTLEILGGDTMIHCAEFDPYGGIVSAGDDKMLRFWKPQEDPPMRILQVRNGFKIGCVAFSPDGQLLAIGDGNAGYVEVWELEQQVPVVHALLAHAGPVHHVVFSPDGKRLTSSGADKTLKLWLSFLLWRAGVK